MNVFGWFPQKGKLIFYCALISMLCLSACQSRANQLSFNPALFKRQNVEKQCLLFVDNVSTRFPNPNARDVLIHVQGTLNAYCTNLQVGIQSPDMAKNIRIEVKADTTTAAGGTERPFDVELTSRALRYGTYTLWVNGNAMTTLSVE